MNLPAAVEPWLVRYRSLEVRERQALVALAIFLAGLLIYFAIWQPVNDYRADAQAERDRQLGLLQYMRASERQARASDNTQRTGLSGQALLSEVSRQAQGHGIKPNRLQPEGDNAVSVWFDGVPFDTLVKLLADMERERGIVVRQIAIDREDRPGLVRARVVLRT